MSETPNKWLTGDAYENFMGRWSRQLALVFLDWLAPSAALNWLEVGCGTGALTQAIALRANPASIIACDPSPQFVSFARQALVHPAITFLEADAEALPYRENGFDAVTAGLALNFIPSPAEAVRAMTSRLRPGGMLTAYVWDYDDGMQFLRIFWETAVELDPRAADLDERGRFPVCRPGALARLLENAGLHRITPGKLEIATHFLDFDNFWAPFLGRTGWAPSYVHSLQPDALERLRLRLQQRLAPTAGRSIQLTARAWAVRGFVL